jgi:hypothetical protein
MKRGSSGWQLGVNLATHANVIGKAGKRDFLSRATHFCFPQALLGQFHSQIPPLRGKLLPCHIIPLPPTYRLLPITPSSGQLSHLPNPRHWLTIVDAVRLSRARYPPFSHVNNTF